MAVKASPYRTQLQALLPLGSAWPRSPNTTLTKLLDAFALELERVGDRALQVLEESDPRSTIELLPDWERVCGLPDTCSAGLATTIQERRAAVVAKLTAIGGASIAYFTDLAASMGYDIEIEEFRPFITGLSRCGAMLLGDHPVRHQWRVRVVGPRFTQFRTGASQCGDRLGKIARAEDLECKLKRLKQAHTTLIFSYEGA